ncbi:MAG: bifunctional (p)ppGpp synthetase/guanosine-3',5'-bis(diphosphate) 3'-pyrophosphohydrolase [Alphaproteobacteria bacterium]|nr:bifunctional (p)ppGpp synthetase/guanosine-3',5'-bis(diphosphate) 3'-pyrophosphohydrolase [Alphaproteobacteria bacterium]MCL2505788.1 bifunctional (p)ppGpp synthetase/guanosine-3',5'-bis(diphosphate) 3'-pyrophosphohydrolase [Alphaproteobacteria bacterium]
MQGSSEKSNITIPLMSAEELIERVHAYDKNVNEELLKKAYAFSQQSHSNQQRASGEPYFSHPLAVAEILTGLRMDSIGLAATLLHDTVEDTIASMEDIKRLFGDEVAKLVDGVTKLSKIKLKKEQSTQAENFRKLIIAMSVDIRVLLIKLADRLHNMRTIQYLPKPEKRKNIARETLEIYAPLAQRIGVERMQDELEDLSFAEINPDTRDSIIARLHFLRDRGGNITQRIVKELGTLLHDEGIEAKVEGREKAPYSVWRKMQRKNVGFEQLSDIMAFRIYVDTVSECYQALGVIHSHYHVIPGRFKDYISTPKPNRYQSLHTGILGPEKQRIEIQIRTYEMHEIAEFGVAAHWAYKSGGGPKKDGIEYHWLRELLDIVEHAHKSEEFLQNTKLELFQDQVFCFSPKGDLIALPQGASPVDFAYAIHGRVGDTCTGAKVNGRIVPLRTVLRNGDQVEIITQKGSNPSPAWERFVVTGKAKSCIRRFIRTQQRTEYIILGKSILEKLCKQESIEYSEKAFLSVCADFQADSVDDLFANIGAFPNTARDIFNAAYPNHKLKPIEKDPDKIVKTSRDKIKSQNNVPITLKGLIPGMAVHYARCCHPIPGDSIVGIVTTGRGVTIHTADCETLENFMASPERWIDVGWDDKQHDDNSEKLIARLNVVLANQPNNFANMTTIIGKNNANIFNLKITNRTADFFDFILDLEVRDTQHLSDIIAAIRACPAVNSVERAKGR